MRLAISNIAWDIAEDGQVAALLQRFAVDAIDVAPSKYFPKPEQASDADIEAVKRWWNERGIAITGMQSLLFGTVGLNVFGNETVRAALLAHLAAVCRIAAGLGVRWLVFGSPKNRDRSGLSDEQTQTIALSFFRQLGDIAAQHGVVVCLEPNPTCYGANFMTDTAQTAAVVKAVDHPAIGLQLDTGALAINGNDPLAVLAEHAALIGHVHASEPNLVPLGDGSTDHGKMAEAIARYVPDRLVTIEMVATQAESHLHAIERALRVATAYYREAGACP